MQMQSLVGCHFAFLCFQTKCIPIICHFRFPICYTFYVYCQPFVITYYRGGTKWGALGQPSPHSPPYIFRSSGVQKSNPKEIILKAVLRIRIRIRRILMFLSRPDPPPGFIYHQAKIVWKTFIFTVLWLLYDFLSLKNYVNVPSKSNKQKNLRNKIFVCLCLQDHRRKWQDPDPLVRCMDPRIRIRTKISWIRNTV